MKKIFVTGITGLVGSAFVTALSRDQKGTKFVCLTRKSPVKSAYDRVYDIVKEQCEFDGTPELFDEIIGNIEVVDGDVTTVNPAEIVKLPEMAGVNSMFHCAADVNLGKDPTGKTFKINYNGTENMIAIAKLLNLKEFHYVSTAYVAGKTIGRAMEARPTCNEFNNPYESSKFQSEGLVRDCGIPFTIYRPGIITGRLEDGKIRKPLAFYRILEFLAKLKSHHCAKEGINPAEEYDLNLHFNTVASERIYFTPIDYVQYAITKLFQKDVANQTFHVTGDSPVNTDMIDRALCRVLKLKYMEVSKSKDAEALNKDSKMLERFIGDLFPYFANDVIFDQTNVRSALGDEALAWTYDDRKMELMMREFFIKFFNNVPWVQEILEATK